MINSTCFHWRLTLNIFDDNRMFLRNLRYDTENYGQQYMLSLGVTLFMFYGYRAFWWRSGYQCPTRHINRPTTRQWKRIGSREWHWKHLAANSVIFVVLIIICENFDTICSCQRPVFSLGVSQLIYEITNLWKFELNCSSKIIMGERKIQPCHTKLCAFRCLI